MSARDTSFVRTIGERCRTCYTCVRECPAKAIRIAGGQAEILPERCICCGNCVRVCSQGAKQIVTCIDEVLAALEGGGPVLATLAPSFPAEFDDMTPQQLVGMIRKLGFANVSEVAFGADLVAQRYAKLLEDAPDKSYVATSCPALVEFVERYHPDIIDSLAPIVSPMVAMGRALREIHGPDIRVVFVGPCAAKKREAASRPVEGAVDWAITFVELREMFKARGVRAEDIEPTEFDLPHPGLGALFPISRGLLQAAGIQEDLLSENVIVTDGRTSFTESLREYESGAIHAGLLEILCCDGCIMGPGTSSTATLHERRSRVSRYVRESIKRGEPADQDRWYRRFRALDLARGYEANDQRIILPDERRRVEDILARMGKLEPKDELNCGACGYDTCRDHAVAIMKGLAESEMCLPYTIERLREAYQEVANSHDQLASAREALMQAEKLASMGQLAAGIAHEVNNPLGVVVLYSHMLRGQVQDAKTREDIEMIVEQADRCKKIVSGLLHFARRNKVDLRETDLDELLRRAVKALDLPGSIEVTFEKNCDDMTAEIDRDQIVQVLNNLIGNARDAMHGSGRLHIVFDGDEASVKFSVRDSGIGIAEENRAKIFEPFFTTKQIGKGTGLGLSVTYGIIKMHRGDVSLESNADPAAGPTGTCFTVTLPRRGQV